MSKLIIDANLLLLFVIGFVNNGNYISKSDRLKKFNKADFDILLEILKEFKEVYVTPYIAAEVSNLIDIKGKMGNEIYDKYQLLLSEILIQTDVIIREDCKSNFFSRYGLTDSNLISLVNEFSILTDDNRMCSELYGVNPSNVLQFEVVKELFKK
ncbi:hypothetical protein [Acinetobacter modestus]|uniref:hypothetical protein n=1 Tax=Acinetobacter modestus TaxID=1776740 RepID=UPI0030183D5F